MGEIILLMEPARRIHDGLAFVRYLLAAAVSQLLNIRRHKISAVVLVPVAAFRVDKDGNSRPTGPFDNQLGHAVRQNAFFIIRQNHAV